MRITEQNVDEWVERFQDGATTNEEEQMLYRFFRNGRVPAHLQGLKPMFAWYEAGMSGTPEEFLRRQKRETLQRRLLLRSISIAACVMLLAGAGWTGLHYRQERAERECYEGSYVVINGQRIADIEKIMPYIRETLTEADRMEREQAMIQETLCRLASSTEEMEQRLTQGVMNEEVRCAIREALN